MNPKYTPRFIGPITPEEVMARFLEYKLVMSGGAFIPWIKINGGK